MSHAGTRKNLILQKNLTFVLIASIVWVVAGCSASQKNQQQQPNVLFLIAEDLSPRHLGPYGSKIARTPNLDQLAQEGVRYTRVFSASPVCGPARYTLARGIYASALGGHNMRHAPPEPDNIKVFTELLMDAGYYTYNPGKREGFGSQPWSANTRGEAHWRNRPEGKPFFGLYSFKVTHESSTRGGEKARRTPDVPDSQRTDPADVEIPPYHPDVPEIRDAWAEINDMVNQLDREVGRILEQLEEDGLADETIVFVFSDHGDGMPRSKRAPYDTGLQVPLIIRFPDRYQHWAPDEPGTAVGRIVNFADFAPSVLEMCGVEVPDWMKGKSFVGPDPDVPRRYSFGLRDRMAERYNMFRTLRDQRYRYVRNYMPHRELGQHVEFMYKGAPVRVWEKLYQQDKLNEVQSRFFEKPRPVEELYDTKEDPYAIQNLADDPQYSDVLMRMRKGLDQQIRSIVDLGFMPEGMLMHRFGDVPPATAVQQDPETYPLERILNTANIVRDESDEGALKMLVDRLNDPAPVVRYQAIMGLMFLGKQSVPAQTVIRERLTDRWPDIQIAAAEWLVLHTEHREESLQVLLEHLQSDKLSVALHAANALDHLDERANPVLPTIKKMSKRPEIGKWNIWVQPVLEKALADL